MISEQGQMPGNMISLAERMVFSDSFKPIYSEGMDMVEEAASYLDGEGREEARTLSRVAATLYAAESMRLTTRLMQVASWLLLQRAARNGEMSRQQVESEKAKVRLDTPSAGDVAAGWNELPSLNLSSVRSAFRHACAAWIAMSMAKSFRCRPHHAAIRCRIRLYCSKPLSALPDIFLMCASRRACFSFVHIYAVK